MKEVLSQKQVQYAYVDILESIGKLKLFLKLRDTSPAYEKIREAHTVGIPLLAVEDEHYVLEDAAHVARLIDELGLSPAGAEN